MAGEIFQFGMQLFLYGNIDLVCLLAIMAIDSYRLPVLFLISVVFLVSTQGFMLLVRLLFSLLIFQGFDVIFC